MSPTSQYYFEIRDLADSTFGAKNENCDSLEAANKCESDCETVNLECLVTCAGDTSCLSQCSREFLTCVDNCPCFINCYEGCPCDYGSEYCGTECIEANQKDYDKCESDASDLLDACQADCDISDRDCNFHCLDLFYNELDQCPCMSGCPDGCPCPGFECEESEIEKDPVPVQDMHLLLMPYNNKQAAKLSLYLTGSFFQHKQYSGILDLNEFNVIEENPYFGKSSCSFTVSGVNYALGHCSESDSDPEKCFRLWKIGSTKVEPTDTDFITVNSEIFGWKCTSLNDRGHMLLVQNDGVSFVEHLVFDENGMDSESVLSELKSDHVHGSLTNYNGNLVLVGGYLDGGNKNIESAMFENQAITWDIVGKMNVEDKYFGVNMASWKQSMVELNQYIYAFGGYHMYNADLIVESNKVLRINSKYETKILDQQLKRSKPNILSLTDGISIVHFDMDSDEIEVWHQNENRFDVFTKTIPDLSFPVAVFSVTETEYNPTEPDPIPDIKLFIKSPIDRITKEWSWTKSDQSETMVPGLAPQEFTNPQYMCSYKIKNRMFIVGSKTDHPVNFRRQRWEITKGGFEKLHDLEIDFDEGRCLGFGDESVLLCSPYLKGRQCWLHNQLENTYSRLSDSYHDHYRGELVNYNDTVLLIAGAQTRDVDLLENASSWRMINEVPAKMKSFGAVNLNGFIYIFGGENVTTKVCMYNHIEWISLPQKLNRGRYRHSSIVQNDFIIHSGGNGNFFMEIWELKGLDENGIPEFTIYDSITTLTGWHSYPYVFPMELL